MEIRGTNAPAPGARRLRRFSVPLPWGKSLSRVIARGSGVNAARLQMPASGSSNSLSAGTMQLADRRRLGGSRRSTFARAFLAPLWVPHSGSAFEPRKRRTSAQCGRCEPPRRRRSCRIVPAQSSGFIRVHPWFKIFPAEPRFTASVAAAPSRNPCRSPSPFAVFRHAGIFRRNPRAPDSRANICRTPRRCPSSADRPAA